jgi:YVTN family beta-propeller protein
MLNPTNYRTHIKRIFYSLILLSMPVYAGQVIETVSVGLQPVSVTVNTSTNKVYVANRDENTLSVLNAKTNIVEATIPTGSAPCAVAVNPTNNKIYVLNCDNKNIWVIDGQSNTLTDIISGGNPVDIAVNTKSNRLYVLREDIGGLSVYDENNSFVESQTTGMLPYDIAVDSENGLIYVINHESSSLVILRDSDLAGIGYVQFIRDYRFPTKVAVNPKSNRVYVSHPLSKSITVHDARTAEQFSNIPIGKGIADLAVDTFNNSLYVASGSILVLDNTNSLVNSIQLPYTAGSMFSDNVNNRLYVVHSEPGKLSIIYNDVTAGITSASISPSPTSAGWYNSDVSISLAATDNDAGVGISNIHYTVNGVVTMVEGDSANIVVTTEGTSNISFYSTDKAGNVEEPRSVEIKIDKSGPTLTCDEASSIWHASNVNILCKASDTLSGLNDASHEKFILSTEVLEGEESADAATFSQEVCDMAGNCATAGPIKGNKVDRKGPDVTVTSPSAKTYTLNEIVNASFTCSDNGSGVATCTGAAENGTAIDTSTLGKKTFSVTATDNAGNSTTKEISYEVIENEPPVTTSSLSSMAGESGWHKSSVTVSLNATDSQSGVKELLYSLNGITKTTTADSISINLDTEGINTLSFYARDKAGNVEHEKKIVVKIDKTAPEVSCDKPADTWHKDDVYIQCKANDSASGLGVSVSQSTFSLSTAVPAGTETINATTGSQKICDLAGNCVTAGPFTNIKVDKAGPQINITSPTASTSYTIGAIAKVQYSCSDAGAGIARCTGTVANQSALDTSRMGEHTIKVTAEDNLGNVVEKTVTYNVACRVKPLHNQKLVFKRNSMAHFRMELENAFGANASSASIPVRVLGLTLPDKRFIPLNFVFTYKNNRSYEASYKTTHIPEGTYGLIIQVGNCKSQQLITFEIR